jgi:hypothetical protein
LGNKDKKKRRAGALSSPGPISGAVALSNPSADFRFEDLLVFF